MIDVTERLHGPDGIEAAREILRLRLENDKLREALKPFANMLEEKFKIHQHDDTWIALVNHDVLMRLCNAARALLNGDN